MEENERNAAIWQNGNTGAHYCNGFCLSNADHLERVTNELGCRSAEQFTKNDEGKARHDLIPPEFLDILAKQLTYGARRYRPDNWKKGEKHRYYNALMRHLGALRNGETVDEDGRPHHYALAANAMFLVYFYHMDYTNEF